MIYKSRKYCLSCNKSNLKEIMNLGLHSYADRFIPKKLLKKKDPKFPLILQLCKKCNFIQSKIITPAKDRYSTVEYSYTSSNSDYAKDHWREFSRYLEKKFILKNKKIIEIGSNDGFLSEILQKKGAKVLCVDASELMIKLSKKKKLKSIHSIFDYKQSRLIKEIFGPADIIIANNVFNHANNPTDFIKGVKNLLVTKSGVFIFEQPDFTVGALTHKFDQIYHEHVSYFTATNIKNIIEKNNLKIKHISKNKYHGGSLRTIAGFHKIGKTSKNLLIYLKNENMNKIYSIGFYQKLMKKIYENKVLINKKIDKLKNNNFTIVGIGAGAKCNTFLTYNDLDDKKIDFITDSSRLKQNKYTPSTKILIKDDNEIKKYKKIACIILIWNISKIVVKNIKQINNKVKFIRT